MYCLEITDSCEIYPQRDEYHRLYNVEIEPCSSIINFLKEHAIPYDIDFDYINDNNHWVELLIKEEHHAVFIAMSLPLDIIAVREAG